MKIVIEIPKTLYERAKKPPILGMYEEIIGKGTMLDNGLDKIRAEIKQVAEEESKFDKKWAQGLKYALKIIEKYIESEE